MSGRTGAHALMLPLRAACGAQACVQQAGRLYKVRYRDLASVAAALAHPPPCLPSPTAAVRGVLGRAYLDDPDYREAVCFALLRAVQGALKRYGSTAAEDEALLRQQGAAALDWRAACAVRVRLGEKQLLGRLKGAVMALLSEGSGGSRSEGGSSEDDEDDEDELGSDSELGSGSSGSGDSDSEGSEGESESASEGSKGELWGALRRLAAAGVGLLAGRWL